MGFFLTKAFDISYFMSANSIAGHRRTCEIRWTNKFNPEFLDLRNVDVCTNTIHPAVYLFLKPVGFPNRWSLKYNMTDCILILFGKW